MNELCSPIQKIIGFQCAAKCNNELFMKYIKREIESNPDCHVWQRAKRIIEEQNHDAYLSRIWILREWDLIDFEDMFDDTVFWYEKYRETIPAESIGERMRKQAAKEKGDCPYMDR